MGVRINDQPALSRSPLARTVRMTDLLQLSYEPILVWRVNGDIESWNDAAERLYGFTAEEALGKISHTLLRTRFPVELEELTAQLQTHGYWSGELHHICRDGREVTVDSRMQLLDDGSVLEANRDVTERKQAEVALRESEQRLRWIGSIVESSDDAIVSKDLNGTILSWNRGAERLFGHLAKEIVGQSITLIIPDELLDEERMILARISQGERIDHFETVRRRKDGSLVNISLTVSPVKDADGKIVGASKIARDITEQKRNREYIGVLAREAEHRSKNVLSNVQAIVNLSQADSAADLKQAISGRLQAMSNVHSLFVERRWVGAEVSAIARQELAPYLDDHDSRVVIEGPETVLKPDAAQAVAVVLHELATNASKYGALSQRRGRIALTWSHAPDGRLTFRWCETGGPAVSVPERQGFGSSLIERTVGQLGGKTGFDWRAEGLVCEIVLPA